MENQQPERSESGYDSIEHCSKLMHFGREIEEVVLGLFEENTLFLRSDSIKHWNCDGDRVLFFQNDDDAMKAALVQVSNHFAKDIKLIDLAQKVRELSREIHACLVQLPEEIIASDQDIVSISETIDAQIGELQDKMNECRFGIDSLLQLRN